MQLPAGGPDRAGSAGPMQRLFFALRPDGPMRERLVEAVHRAVHRSGGRPVAGEQLHLTLAFLGAVPAARLVALAEIASAAARAVELTEGPLEIVLERLDYWARPKVLCAVPLESPRALGRLASGLLEGLTAAGFTPDLKTFRPHVTVARKVLRPSESCAMSPIRWRFERFALIESRTEPGGVVYSVVATHPLFIGADARK